MNDARPAYEPIDFWSDPQVDECDALVLRTAGRLLTIWFARARSEAWEPVALDLVPMSPLREDMPPDAFRQWLRRSLKDRAHFIADQVRNGDVPPLEQAAIRGIPTQAAVGFRAEYKLDEALARQDAFPGAEASTALTRRELDRARMVQDALDYRWARLAGVPAVKLIARRRGISEASAKQRIFRARQEGVLQPDPGFDLTSEGQQLRYELHYRLTGTRILGEA